MFTFRSEDGHELAAVNLERDILQYDADGTIADQFLEARRCLHLYHQKVGIR